MKPAEHELIAESAAKVFETSRKLEAVGFVPSRPVTAGGRALDLCERFGIGSPANSFICAVSILDALSMANGIPPRELVGAILLGAPSDDDWQAAYGERRAAAVARLAADTAVSAAAAEEPLPEPDCLLAAVTSEIVDSYIAGRAVAADDLPSESVDPTDQASYARSLLTVAVSGLLDVARISGIPPLELVASVAAGLPGVEDWVRRLDGIEGAAFVAGSLALSHDESMRAGDTEGAP